MPDIMLTRIDNRLVHGQVGVAWASSLGGCNLIVVADDIAAKDPVQQSLMWQQLYFQLHFYILPV